jgi:hypothetical protein
MAQDGETVETKILLAEYDRIKEEQKFRIGFRDNLLYVHLASLAAIVASVLASDVRPYLLLLVPPVSFVLGWTYLVNDHKISMIGRYIREDLSVRLTEASTLSGSVFGWEATHRTDSRRVSRKHFQLVVDLTAFCLPACGALIVAWANGLGSIVLIALSVIELISIIALGFQIAAYADLSK